MHSSCDLTVAIYKCDYARALRIIKLIKTSILNIEASMRTTSDPDAEEL